MKREQLPYSFRYPILFSLLIGIFLFPDQGKATGFQGGDEVTISEADSGDLYLAGGEVSVKSDVDGDLLIAGGEVSVDGDVSQDLMISGGSIEVKGKVGDDLRIFGGTSQIKNDVQGDLLVFGGKLQIEEGAVVHGMIKVYGGEIRLDGEAKGKVDVAGGDFEQNGSVGGQLRVRSGKTRIAGPVEGKSFLATRELSVGNGAAFSNDVHYWRESGELDLSPYMESGEAILDVGLKGQAMSDFNWGYVLFGVTVFWIVYLLSATLMLFLLNFLLTRTFQRAGIAMEHFTKSLGFGALYLFGLPIACLILMITLVGAPIALVGGTVWGLSILFAHLLTAVVVTHWIKVKYNKGWDRTYLFLVSLAIYVLVKLMNLIPILGFLLSLILVMASFGALYLGRRALFTNKPMLRL